MPSPLARRIAPTISDDMKKKIQLAVKTKENKVKRAVKKEVPDDVINVCTGVKITLFDLFLFYI